MSDPKKIKQMSDLDMFDELFPMLVENLTKNGMNDPEISDAMKWFKTVRALQI